MIPYREMRAALLEHLRYERQCPLIAMERGPWAHLGHRPDVLALTKKRELLEVEIKRSFQDFKQDAEKRIWHNRDLWKHAWPHFFMYYVPPDLVDKVRPLVRDGFGLLTYDVSQLNYVGLPTVVSVKRATRQKDAKTLTTRQLVEMVGHLTGTMVSTEVALAKLERETNAPEVTAPDSSLAPTG